MVSAAIALLGYVLLATCAESNHKVSYFAMYLITGGAYSLFPLVMSVFSGFPVMVLGAQRVRFWIQELGGEYFRSDLQAWSWNCIHRIHLQLCLDVS